MNAKKSRRALACGLALALALALLGPIRAIAAVQTNYLWYKGHESAASYTIGTAGEMKALAQLVNGTADYDGDGKVDAAVSFEGKTITLSAGAPINFLGEGITPIGTAAHPFQGTFDGTARQIDNFTIAITAASSAPVRNIGLFGYVGSKGRLEGVSVGARSSVNVIRSASSTDYIVNVGMVAGYCGGTMANCSNAGSVGIASAVVQQGVSDYLPVRNVGGVAGQCVFDMSSCSNAGAVTVHETSAPVAAIEHSQLVARVGGVAGLLGDESRIGNYATHIYGDASKHGSITGCSNTGMLTVDTPSAAGLDRFGQQANAESACVGGVVGYSQGSVIDCVNGVAQSSVAGQSDLQDVGYVKAENGSQAGGVAGSVRGVLADNVNVASADDGADGNDPLVLSGCENYGDVYARVTVGGIAGKTGSYVTVMDCLSARKKDYFGNWEGTYIIATRWNKPGPGGIVGTANGEVSYCANFATVASGRWSDESERDFTTQDGYYAAGIVGMLAYFDAQADDEDGKSTPISEVYSCLNAGSIVAGANMRQRGIVGENDGYVHDCVLLKGVVYNDDIVYGDTADETEASGSVGENRVYSSSDLRGGKAAEAVAFLNANSEAGEWQHYWILPKDSTSAGLNSGYPLLNSQNPWGDSARLLVDATVSLVSDAPYTGGESVPAVKVQLDGSTLTQNADFRVLPEQGAVEPSTGRPYRAQVVGLGRYQGTASQTAAYDIVAGDFSTCRLTVAPHTFDYEAQAPKADDVTVRTPAGTTVDPGEYSFKLVDASGNEIDDPVDVGSYRVMATANEGSDKFTGKVAGTYRIKPASLMRDVSYDDTVISYLGRDYPWVDSTKKGESDNPSTTLPYTGVSVKPDVGSVTYKGHTLIEGTDYKVVYGNSNSDDGYADDLDDSNMGKAGGSTVGCVTVRYVLGRKCNFTSYSNMFFKIVDDGSKTDISNARAVVEGEQVADGSDIEPVRLYLGNTVLTEGTDYTIHYADNRDPGTASFIATGIGRFTGRLEGTFEIQEGSVYEFSFAYSGTGAEGDPYEAAVTGVTYLSSRATFDMVIPETVSHDGHDYSVTAVADSAFGGPGPSSFTGSDQNASKAKIGSVFVPASVRSLGDYAFGTSSITMTDESLPQLAAVTFGAGSQLETIGKYAFAQCKNLQKLTMPANVSAIGDYAFWKCSALSELRFLTESVALPSSISDTAFTACDGVVVRGFANAEAVVSFAADNGRTNPASGAPVAGKNGGRRFSFQPLDSIADAVVAEIPEQTYTGNAVKPAVVVTLGQARLSEGIDYELSYEDNVDAGVARAVVIGLGDLGGQVSREFTIAPVSIARATYSRLSDRMFTGSPVDMAATLAFNGRTLRDGSDYTAAYADLSSAPIEAPSAVGTYRLVITGAGNFTGSTYRTFRIVALSVESSVRAAIGDKVYTGAPIEPDVTASVGSVALERDRDYVLSYADNVEVGEATVNMFGIGSYDGAAVQKFRIVQASVAGAVIAGVGDVRAAADGAAVDFDPVVVVGGVRLSGDDYTVGYAVSSDGGSTYEAIDGPPSAVGDYEVVIRGKGNYRDSAHAAFSITSDAPAVKTDLSGAEVKLDQNAFSYDGTAHEPGVTVALTAGGTALTEGADYVVVYSGNVAAGQADDAVAAVYGIGDYGGSAEARFTVSPAEIGDASVRAMPDVEYTGSDIAPHPVVQVGGRTLSEGVDFTVEYADNRLPGTATVTVTAVEGSGYVGSGAIEFAILKADVSSAELALEYDSTTWTGADLRPTVTATLAGRALEPDVEYEVDYADNRAVGWATVTVTGVGNCTGQAAAKFVIRPVTIEAPSAAAGLVYTGSALVGVAAGGGYSVTGGVGAAAGSYTATVSLGEGHRWADGSYDDIEVPWSIAPRSIAAAAITLQKAGGIYDGTVQAGAVKSVVCDGRALSSADYTVAATSGRNAGVYKLTVTGRGNYTGARTASYSIGKAAGTMKVKVGKKSLKRKALKKKARTVAPFKVTGANGQVSFKKASGSKKLTVNSKTGKVKVKKGTKKGTYKIKVVVADAGDGNHNAQAGTYTAKVVVKK